MSKVVEVVHRCRRCEREYSHEEYEALPTKELVPGRRPWPMCSCGNVEFNHTTDSDDDE